MSILNQVFNSWIHEVLNELINELNELNELSDVIGKWQILTRSAVNFYL